MRPGFVVRIHREARVPYPASRMYELVNDIEAYPSFLPWCPQAEVLQRRAEEVVARLTLARGGLHLSFTTRNALAPGQRIDLHLQDGPFRHLHGIWTFEEQPHGSKVALDIEFEAKGSVRLLAVPIVFAEVCNRMVQSFVAEARRRERAGDAH